MKVKPAKYVRYPREGVAGPQALGIKITEREVVVIQVVKFINGPPEQWERQGKRQKQSSRQYQEKEPVFSEGE
jgi:hypothetical protein